MVHIICSNNKLKTFKKCYISIAILIAVLKVPNNQLLYCEWNLNNSKTYYLSYMMEIIYYYNHLKFNLISD